MAVAVEQLARTIKQTQWRHHRALDRRLRPLGSTVVQWDALRALARTPGASAHELALATFQSDQAFGTLATRLVSQGLITREPGRGRRIDHHLTPAGQELLDRGNAVAREVFATSFAELSEAERGQLLALLERLGQTEPAEATSPSQGD